MRKYVTNTDLHVCVPRHISRYGVYTSHLFLVNGVVNFYHRFNFLCILSVLLYTTSVLHWHNIKQYGLYKTLDMLCTFTVVNYITFVDSYYFLQRDRQLWLLLKSIGILSYFVNKYIEFYQIGVGEAGNLGGELIKNVNKPYKYFSLKYTLPGTKERELAHYYSVYVHIFFLHICLALCCIKGVIHSPYHISS